MRWLGLIAAGALLLAVVPAAAHEFDYLPVRNGVEASAFYEWTDVGFVSVRVVEGLILLPGDSGKKAAKGSPRVVVTIRAYGPKACDLEAETVRTRVFHGTLVTDDSDGSAGIAVFDGDRAAVVNGVVPVHVHDELWGIKEKEPPDTPVPLEFLCVYDDEPGGEMWVVDFVLLEDSVYYEDLNLDARWEHVEVVQGQGKGKGKRTPQTELLYEVSFAIDLDGDGLAETPANADDMQADLYSISRGVSISYFYE
jgi:hypothetical protein